MFRTCGNIHYDYNMTYTYISQDHIHNTKDLAIMSSFLQTTLHKE